LDLDHKKHSRGRETLALRPPVPRRETVLGEPESPQTDPSNPTETWKKVSSVELYYI
jgi:hypothetical protein